MNALIITDRREIQAEFARRLNAGGFTTNVVGDGTGLAKCNLAEGPLLVVIDGAGANPWDCCRRIRSRTDGNLALIWVITDRNDPETLRTALAAGADEYCTWPPDPDVLDLHLAAAVRRVAAMEEIPHAKAALQESVERWTLAQRGSHAGVWDAKPDGLPLDSPELPFGTPRA